MKALTTTLNIKALIRATPKFNRQTRIIPSTDSLLQMGSLAIVVCGLVLTMFWVSLLGYGFFALVSSAI